ncbi:hypothetical protein [Clostridium sp. VAP51]|uniref:hypothetical protein n=1 Tax=Clostridium sp. VAP51 TaxID=2949978 RepID=UPI002079E637|nr:hypothetical protein [Clostridium sp. VAP51]
MAIVENELEQIQYFIIKLNKWYSDNQRQIQSNEFVYNKEIHIEVQKNIEEYTRQIEEYIENNEGEINQEKLGAMIIIDKKKVFIVHGHDELAV